ncbi:MAG TPA: hypothetical protein VKJ47_05190, partial [Candidatus Binatia bacterium]|nr:hypothetical protein [Candidatus Binatia bacterium]
MDTPGHFETLPPKQQRAVLALLTCPDVATAAKTARVGRSTLHVWLKEPAFAAALEDARTEQTTEALALLRAGLIGSVQRLTALMHGDEPGIALRAAQTLLEHAMKLRQERAQLLSIPEAMKIQEAFLGVVLDSLA